MTSWALLALKAPDSGKSRLAAVLSPAERDTLMRTMLDHVMHAIAGARRIDRVAIVTQWVDALPGAVLALPDPGLGLNEAIESGARAVAALGARELLVLHADLPRLRSAEIDALVLQGRDTGCAIAPDRHGSGTNALYLSPPGGFEFRFGAGSFERHLREAGACGREASIVSLPGFAFDVDEPADLEALAETALVEPLEQGIRSNA